MTLHSNETEVSHGQSGVNRMFRVGATIQGPVFNEPMRVVTAQTAGEQAWLLGLVGTKSGKYRSVTLTDKDLDALTVLESSLTYMGDGKLLRLGLQAYTLGIAHEFDPYFGLSISRVDPLPHQLAAVYDNLLKLARIRFLLAFHEHLEARFPAEVCALYEKIVYEILARASDRATYREAAGYLQRMAELGSGARAREMVEQLTSRYRNRRAMVEELHRVKS